VIRCWHGLVSLYDLLFFAFEHVAFILLNRFIVAYTRSGVKALYAKCQ